ncbi:DNA mismatch repair endonuclease MutL [Texcoconibacillus texcoconensis]|uniref:DNA mismatch repair protein MutL n=1 Tax=Texcoconibacillus texcoconensis TaxID=1095777 RepID=A0A840QIN2_9BACI|nr:DNA mismatch repair endonuclease MutL [Texcoconibacillus texcoconensis]MBB5171989.1 DNA mismatch repair protein MutL [Texcoconibacillus texcoconensis]
MTATIKVLDDFLANKIAAGEVVERPASVVKELVENALDAGSRSIQVDVKEGGLSYIRINDDGQGIPSDECKNAFERHATSKIHSSRDLFRIETLGFRGEALPSIASVSSLTLRTSQGEGPGIELQIQGGAINNETTIGRSRGTEVIVENLFFNTPARLKYMKTIHTELGHISDCINRMAMAHPDVSFQLRHNDRVLLKTNGNGDLLQVVASIYGVSTAQHMIKIDASSLDFQVTGYIAKPEVTRSSRQYMSTFINERYVRHYGLNRAIHDGFHTLLPVGRHPVVVLHINMDPQLVDVNVHPSKLEVRLSKEKELVDTVSEAIKKALSREQLIPDVAKPRPKAKTPSEQLSLSFSSASQPSSVHETNKMTEPEVGEQEENHIIVQHDTEGVKEEGTTPRFSSQQTFESQEEYQEAAPTTVEQPSVEQPKDSSNIAKQEVQTETVAEAEDEDEQERIPDLEPIGQLHGTYILSQSEDGLYIVDQHAAQERIYYEMFYEKLANETADQQSLLVPLTFEWTVNVATRIEEEKEKLENLGLFFEPFGSKTYIVRSHPSWFPKGEEAEMIEEIVEKVIDNPRITLGQIREEAAILMSCKAAIKANRYLQREEMVQLLGDLNECQQPYTCPHGRPIVVHFSSYDMEKMFKRVM